MRRVVLSRWWSPFWLLWSVGFGTWAASDGLWAAALIHLLGAGLQGFFIGSAFERGRWS